MKKISLLLLFFFSFFLFLSCDKDININEEKEMLSYNEMNYTDDYLHKISQSDIINALRMPDSLGVVSHDYNGLRFLNLDYDFFAEIDSIGRDEVENVKNFIHLAVDDNKNELFVFTADDRFQFLLGYSEGYQQGNPINPNLKYVLLTNALAMNELSSTIQEGEDNYEEEHNKDILSGKFSFSDYFSFTKKIMVMEDNSPPIYGDDPVIDIPNPANLNGSWIKYGPYLSRIIRWGQVSPEKTARHPGLVDNHGNVYLGCTITAVGQILKYYENNVVSVLHYDNYPFRGGTVQRNYDVILADISDMIGHTKVGSTSSNNFKARDFINRNVSGVDAWDLVGQLFTINSREHYAILSLGKAQPSISGGDGHAFVVDGYIKTRTKKRWWRNDLYQEYFYMNWGWGEDIRRNENGWFKRYEYNTTNGKFKMNNLLRIRPS